MKYIIFIIDGAADYPIEELERKTPLMVANKPNIDSLAQKGKCGLFRTIPENFSTGSAVANLSILGYNPLVHFHGRGVLEAKALGIELEENDLAFRCNTLCVENERIKNHSAGHISNEEGAELIKAVDEKLGNDRIKFYPGVSYRHLLVLKDGYSEKIECIPPHDHPGEKVNELLPKATSAKGEKTAALLTRLMLDSRPVLEDHPVNIERVQEGKDPANMVWPWSHGRKPDMKTFQELYGLKGAAISAVDLIKGIGLYVGFDVVDVEGATGLYDTNYEGKADACMKALENHDLAYVHVEAADEAGHEGDIPLKIKCIEDFDRRLLGRTLEKLNDKKNIKIAILPDHPTPAEVKTHVSDPVPFLIYTPNLKGDYVTEFNELSVKKGEHGLVEWDEFIRLVLEK